MADYNEDHYEQTLIELFTQRLDYHYLSGYEAQSSFADKDYYTPVYRDRLTIMLRQLNAALPQAALDEAERSCCT